MRVNVFVGVVLSAVLVAATVTPALAAILRTTDGGKSWQDISGAASHYTYTWLSLSGADPADILVGTAGGGAYIGHDSVVSGKASYPRD